MNSITSRINNSDVTIFARSYSDWIVANASKAKKPYTSMALPVALQFFGLLKDCDSIEKVQNILNGMTTTLTQIGAPPIKLVAQDCSKVKIGDRTLSEYANVWQFGLPKHSSTVQTVLPNVADIVAALAKVDNIDASKLDAIAQSVVDEHKPKQTDDLLWFVEYSLKDASANAIVGASDIQSLAGKILKK